jgi:hypothetical protein
MSSIGDKSPRLDRLFSAAKSALGRGKKAARSKQPQGMQAQSHMGKHSFEAAQDAYINPKPLSDPDFRLVGASNRPNAKDAFVANLSGNPIGWDRKDPRAGNALVRQNALRSPNAPGSVALGRQRAQSVPSLRPTLSKRWASSSSSVPSSIDASVLDTDSPLQRLAQNLQTQPPSPNRPSSFSDSGASTAPSHRGSDVDDWAKFG